MKAYTDLEQSRKLAEILPIESADMWYEDIGVMIPRLGSIPKKHTNIEVPCWSLSALLNVLKEPDLIRNSEGKWLSRAWYDEFPYSAGGAENPIDACVNMILKLHELRKL